MTSRKVLMMKEAQKVWIFLLEDDEIVEIHCDKPDSGVRQHVLGNIYVGNMRSTVPNIGAAFIEIESGVECYYDMEARPLMLCSLTKQAGSRSASG